MSKLINYKKYIGLLVFAFALLVVPVSAKADTETRFCKNCNTYTQCERKIFDNSCINKGYRAYICTICGYENFDKELDWYADHDYQLLEKFEPTYERKGYALYKCSVCGDVQNSEYNSHISQEYNKKKLVCKHDYKKTDSKVADLSKNENYGYIKYECTKCGKINADIFTGVIEIGGKVGKVNNGWMGFYGGEEIGVPYQSKFGKASGYTSRFKGQGWHVFDMELIGYNPFPLKKGGTKPKITIMTGKVLGSSNYPNVTSLPSKYYTVTYKNNKKRGVATAIIKFKGIAKGTLRIPFVIK